MGGRPLPRSESRPPARRYPAARAQVHGPAGTRPHLDPGAGTRTRRPRVGTWPPRSTALHPGPPCARGRTREPSVLEASSRGFQARATSVELMDREAVGPPTTFPAPNFGDREQAEIVTSGRITGRPKTPGGLGGKTQTFINSLTGLCSCFKQGRCFVRAKPCTW